jgi:hypothetical protein
MDYPQDVLEFKKENNYPAGPPTLDFNQWKDKELRKEIPYIPAALSPNWPTPKKMQKLYAECKKYKDHFIPHRATGQHKGWESICLWGLSSTHIASHSKYGEDNFTANNKWTDMAAYFPATVKYVKSLNYHRLSRVRIMKLRAGGFIKPHTDRDKFVGGALNISIYNPEECKFFVDGKGYLPFDKSFAIYPNTGFVHCVVNDSNEDRYHIIVHGDQPNTLAECKEESIKLCIE